MNRAAAAGVVVLLWAAIYLPALGTLEIRGEEGRRILPGVTMLETGRWIVPSVGGVDYFAKPPLVNWLIAAAIHFSGTQSEWAVRMPSVLCMLALGLGAVWMLSEWLGTEGALLATVFLLTGIGLMEKGRLAEIESLYACLFGLALMSWLGLWQRTSSRESRTGPEGHPGLAGPGWREWAAWTVPWVFLGLGLLTKGPLHVLFFYSIVAGVLVAVGRARELVRWPHLAGVVLMLAIFAAWMIPYLRETSAARAGSVWFGQIAGRLEVDDAFRLGAWLQFVPRGIINFIPWAVLLPLLWRRVPENRKPILDVDARARTDFAILRGGRWGMAACFLAVNLAPGGLPRYTLPLMTPASVLLALTLTREGKLAPLPEWLPLVWSRTLAACLIVAAIGAGAVGWLGGGWRWVAGLALLALCALFWRQRHSGAGTARSGLLRLALVSGGIMAILTAEYAIGVIPRIHFRERLRPLALRIGRLTGPDQPIYAYDPGFLPLLFYLRPPPRYTQTVGDFPLDARYLLVRDGNIPVVESELKERGRSSQSVLVMKDLNRGTWELLRVNPAGKPGL